MLFFPLRMRLYLRIVDVYNNYVKYDRWLEKNLKIDGTGHNLRVKKVVSHEDILQQQ